MTPLWVKSGKKSGGLFPYTYLGQFGRKKTVDCLEMRSIPFKDYDTLLFVIFGLGLSYF